MWEFLDKVYRPVNVKLNINFMPGRRVAVIEIRDDAGECSLYSIMETLINCLRGILRRAHGAQEPRHI